MPGEWLKRYCLRRIGGEEGLEKLKNMYESGMSVREIMKILGLKSPQCIYELVEPRRRYKKKKKITPEIEEEVLKLRRKGLKIKDIAETIDISVGAVHSVLKKHGLTGRLKKERGF